MTIGFGDCQLGPSSGSSLITTWIDAPVSFSPSARSMIVTHLDGYITVFKLLDGLYRTTLNRMHRPKSFFSTDSEVNDHSVSIMTRSMSRSAAAPISNNRVAENVADNNADSNNAENVADNNADNNIAENVSENTNENNADNTRIREQSRNTLGNSTIRLTDVEQQRAIQARELHIALGHPSDSALGKLLHGGKLRGCSLAARDVEEECVARLLSDMSVVGIIFVAIFRNIFRNIFV